MLRVLKWFGIVLGVLLGIILLAGLSLYVKARMEVTKTYSMPAHAEELPANVGSTSRGEHLATVMCKECHGDDLGGNPAFLDDPLIGKFVTPNLTTGRGGLGAGLTDADFVRIMRRGIKPNGQSVFLMPARDYFYMSNQDLADILAYIRSAPPVDRDTPEPHIRTAIPGTIMYGAGLFGNMLGASLVDQTAEPPAAPEPGVTAEYGEYLVRINSCRDCHGEQLSGGKSAEPGAPLAPNLTDGGETRVWTEAQFISTLRTGVTPSGTKMEYMPWEYKGQMTDDELKAIWAHLRSLPALPTTTEVVTQ
jgi:mono/diheme cytochrome c family protein